jgi:hypothetical protein
MSVAVHLQLRRIQILQTKLPKGCRRYDLHNNINKSQTTISFYWGIKENTVFIADFIQWEKWIR